MSLVQMVTVSDDLIVPFPVMVPDVVVLLDPIQNLYLLSPDNLQYCARFWMQFQLSSYVRELRSFVMKKVERKKYHEIDDDIRIQMERKERNNIWLLVKFRNVRCMKWNTK